ncbi:hypothetical protein IGI04_023207 [Brassica rapa subsp. trilocularis]|uniref:Uncharacterized protein n=1 Tax=Brassica rapa subsp. trilocularis TaxID=1813537 RepID=A0ABQ7M349_BRACM|nr:hypothetical protein IGI04_023207 [Brassica rapa subsp. trilocularis]
MSLFASTDAPLSDYSDTTISIDMSSSETNARNRELRSKRRFDGTSSSSNPQHHPWPRAENTPFDGNSGASGSAMSIAFYPYQIGGSLTSATTWSSFDACQTRHSSATRGTCHANLPAFAVPELRTHRHLLSPTSRTYRTSLCTTRETFRGSWWTLFRPSGLECLVGAGEPQECRHQHQQHAGTVPQRTMRRLMRTPTSPHIPISSPLIMNLANNRQGTSSLTPSTCENFCASPSIDMERITSIDSGRVTSIDMERITSIDKEPKLTSNTNMTSLLVLGLGIHGIGFFRQVWKSSKRYLEAAISKARFRKELLDIGQKEVNRTWWQPPLSFDSWKPVQSWSLILQWKQTLTQEKI